MKDMANKMKAHCKDKIKNGMVFQRLPYKILKATSDVYVILCQIILWLTVHTGDICETGFKIHACIREANPEVRTI